MEIYRILRVLEYVGTDAFIRDAIVKRGVKSEMVMSNGINKISEAFIGETPMLIAQTGQDNLVEKWKHSCDALCQEIALWVHECPHCGRPYDYKEEKREN